jgi:hypothetical protein
MRMSTAAPMAVAIALAPTVSLLASATQVQAASCVAPARAHVIRENTKAVVWLRKTRERKGLRKSYFGCAFSRGRTIRIVWTLREPDGTENCGGTTLSKLVLKGVVVTYDYHAMAGNPHDFRTHQRDRVNLRTGKRKALVNDERASECA